MAQGESTRMKTKRPRTDQSGKGSDNLELRQSPESCSWRLKSCAFKNCFWQHGRHDPRRGGGWVGLFSNHPQQLAMVTSKAVALSAPHPHLPPR